jgi:ribosome-associated toxin RatA of RatAB toxin-antitoxin module
MRTVELALASPVDPDFAFRRITEFERYPEFVDEVRSVIVQSDDGQTLASEWDILFRNGPLRWAEIDYIQAATRSIIFEQTGGDFDMFRGSWHVESAAGGCMVRFETTFDFGIPSLAGVLEPIASKVLKEAIGTIVTRLLGEASIIGEPATSAAVRARIERGCVATEAQPV